MTSLYQHTIQLLFFLYIFAAPLPLCMALYLSTDRKATSYSLARCLLVVLAAWCVLHTLTGLTLGSLGRFDAPSFLLAYALLLGLGLPALIRTKKQWSQAPGRTHSTPPLTRLEMSMLMSVIAAGIALCIRAASDVTTEFDSLWYHLPSMAHWYQTGSLGMLDNLTSNVEYYPYNWDVLCAIFLVPFHGDFLVLLPNIVAWILMGLASYLISTHIGATRIHSIAFACLLLGTPLAMVNVNTMHIDLPLAAMFLTGLYLILLYSETASSVCLVLFLSVVGMVFGIKTSGPGYGAILLAIFAFSKGRLSSLKLPACVCGAALFLFLGGFWYFRNYLNTGNPLGFFEIKIGSTTIFPGTVSGGDFKNWTIAYVFSPFDPSHRALLAYVLAAWLGIPGLIMGLQAVYSLVWFRSIRCAANIKSIAAMFLLTLLTAYLYAVTPCTIRIPVSRWFGQAFRYGFVFIGALAVLCSACARHTRTSNNFLAIGVWMSCLAGIVVSGLIELTYFDKLSAYRPALAALGVLCYVALLAVCHKRFALSVRTTGKRVRSTSGARRYVFVLLLLLSLISVSYLARARKARQRRYLWGNCIDYISDSISEDEITAYPVAEDLYLGFGEHLNRKAVIIPVKDNFTEWFEAIEDANIDLIALPPPPGQLSSSRSDKFRSFLNNHDKLVCVHGTDHHKEMILYRIRPAPGS